MFFFVPPCLMRLYRTGARMCRWRLHVRRARGRGRCVPRRGALDNIDRVPHATTHCRQNVHVRPYHPPASAGVGGGSKSLTGL